MWAYKTIWEKEYGKYNSSSFLIGEWRFLPGIVSHFAWILCHPQKFPWSPYLQTKSAWQIPLSEDKRLSIEPNRAKWLTEAVGGSGDRTSHRPMGWDQKASMEITWKIQYTTMTHFPCWCYWMQKSLRVVCVRNPFTRNVQKRLPYTLEYPVLKTVIRRQLYWNTVFLLCHCL